jgi:hypothetical protein
MTKVNKTPSKGMGQNKLGDINKEKAKKHIKTLE